MTHPRLLQLAAALALLLAVAIPSCNPVGATEAAQKAVTDFHAKLDKGDFKGLYSSANPEFKASTTEADFVALLDAVHRKLGAFKSTSQSTWHVESFNLKTSVHLGYKTKFASGDATELFVYRTEGTQATLLSYDIRSLGLVTK